MSKHVVVIGAGVIGLEIGRQLLHNNNNDPQPPYTVSLVSREFPGDFAPEYTSPWAGGHWRSHASASPADARLRKWERATLEFWNGLIRAGRGGEEVGVKEYPQHHFWDAAVVAVPADGFWWWAPYVGGFRTLSPRLEPVRSVNAGTRGEGREVLRAVGCQSVAFDVDRYLAWLMREITTGGGRVFRRTVSDSASHGLERVLSEVEEAVGARVDVFVNATGLGARKVCGDQTVFPIRGQTVLVKGEANAIRHRIGDGYEAYCIPRPGSGTTILGGTKQKHNWSTRPEDGTTREILENGRVLAPELLTGRDGGFEVVSVQCGLRPARMGGPRVEREQVGQKEVVHAYGHAGAGYQMSYGCAADVVRLVQESLARPSKL